MAGRTGVAGGAPTRVQGAAPGVRLGARGLLVARRKGSRLCGLVGGAVARWQWRHVRAGLAWEGQCAGRGALGARGLLLGRRKGDFFQCAGW